MSGDDADLVLQIFEKLKKAGHAPTSVTLPNGLTVTFGEKRPEPDLSTPDEKQAREQAKRSLWKRVIS